MNNDLQNDLNNKLIDIGGHPLTPTENMVILHIEEDPLGVSINHTKVNHNIIEERETSINKLVTDMGQVSDLFTDLALLVQNQGTNIDNIETNICNSGANIEKANTQLITANNYQKTKRSCLCRLVCCLVILILILLLVLIIKLNIKN